jgi:hypothetical protein
VAFVTADIRKAHGATADLIPETIMKEIPQGELRDRLAYAEDLAARTADPQLAAGYGLIAKAMLTAPPRETTEREVARRYAEAARASDPRRAEALRRSAGELTARYPSAPRREDVAKARAVARARRSGPAAVAAMIAKADAAAAARAVPIAKAKAQASGELTAVFNQNGDLIGVCAAGDIQPVAEAKPSIHNPADPNPAPSAEAGTPADGVAKATRRTARPPAPQSPPTAAVVKASFRNAGTTAEENEAFNQLNAAAIQGLSIIHGRSARPAR